MDSKKIKGRAIALRKQLKGQRKKIRRDVDKISVQFSNLFTSVVGLTGVLGIHKIFFRKNSTFVKDKRSVLSTLLSSYDKKQAVKRFLEFSIGYLVPTLSALLQRIKRTRKDLREVDTDRS